MEQRRSDLLDRNKGSDVKLEEYSFSLSQKIKLHERCFIFIRDFPGTEGFRIKKIISNAPKENFVWLGALMVANVNVCLGGVTDAHNLGPPGAIYDLPTLFRGNGVT